MVLIPSPIIIAAMVFPTVLAPYTSVQRSTISKNDGLRTLLNKLRQDANDLQYQNEILNAEVNRVGKQANELQRSESTLSDIASSQNHDVRKLLALVNENKYIITRMKGIIKHEILADVTEMVLACDRDEDFKLNSAEINALILRMKNLRGVELNENEFRKVLTAQEEVDVNFVISLVQNVMDGTSENTKIMKVYTNKIMNEKVMKKRNKKY